MHDVSKVKVSVLINKINIDQNHYYYFCQNELQTTSILLKYPHFARALLLHVLSLRAGGPMTPPPGLACGRGSKLGRITMYEFK